MIYFKDKNSVKLYRKENVKFLNDRPTFTEGHTQTDVEVGPTVIHPEKPHVSIQEDTAAQPLQPAVVPAEQPAEPPVVPPGTRPQTAPLSDDGPAEDKRYPTRCRSKPKHLQDYVTDSEDHVNSVTHPHYIYHCNRVSMVPTTYEEAIASTDCNKWVTAMESEITSLKVNDTFDLSPLPEGRQPVGGRWVFNVKPQPNGEEKFKARYVARGFSQEQGVDYEETFSPTVKMTTLRTVLSVCAKKNFLIHHMDVKSAFLNAEIDKEIYVEQPLGFESYDKSGNKLYYKLKKSLYGLKQSGRLWNNKIHEFLVKENFVQSQADHCLYTKSVDGNFIYVLIWVDDILIASNTMCLLNELKSNLNKKFEMTDLGLITWFLGISFIHHTDCIEINQKLYIQKLLQRFSMDDCYTKNVPCDSSFKDEISMDSNELADPSLYRELVGSLIYLQTCTRPDLSYTVTKLAQFMSRPTKAQFNAAKNVFKYLKATIDYSLKFTKICSDIKLIGYSDSDWATSHDRKSITGYCFMLDDNDVAISWKTKKQPTVALSSCEAEYMAMTAAIQEGKFLKQILIDLLPNQNSTIFLGVDNQGALLLSKNPVNHQRSKHIDVKYHFIRHEIYIGNVNVFYIHTSVNVADIFTKPTTVKKLKLFSYIFGSCQ